MGTSTSITEFAGKLDKLATELQKTGRPAVTNAAKILKAGAERTLLAAAPSGRLRNVGKSGAKLSVGYTLAGTKLEPTATVQARGSAYPILDNPTRAHWIGSGKSTKKVKSGFAGPARPGRTVGPIKIGGNWVMGPVLHPGTKGKRTFLTGSEAAVPAAMKALADGPRQALQKVF